MRRDTDPWAAGRSSVRIILPCPTCHLPVRFDAHRSERGASGRCATCGRSYRILGGLLTEVEDRAVPPRLPPLELHGSKLTG